MIERNLSSDDRDALTAAVGKAVMRWQDETQAYDEAVGEIVGLNAAERRCMGVLHHGAQTAGTLATVTGLTPAAITALIDRLADRGLVTRKRDVEDRRKVMVEATEAARRMGEVYYGEIARAGEAMLSRFSIAELGIALEFLTAAADLQREHLARLMAPKSRTPAAGR
jgi:DNA-binding MarR family transcriptional regulator